MSIFQQIRNHKIIVQNTGYLTAIEIMRMLLPFVALPYVIRTIGAEKYGTVVFAQTIISYFTIFINWGLDISAVKDVSVHRNEPEELSRIVSSVLGIKTVLFLFSLLILWAGISWIPYLSNHKMLFLFAFLNCLSELFFPIWFYQGIEKMKYLTLIRTTSILFYTISIFLFIHTSEDYEKVVLLQSVGNILAGCLSLYLLFCVNKIKLVYPRYKRLKLAFTSSFPFFMSRLSVILNNTMAKTVSGIFFSMEAVAAFDLAQKIATVALVPMQMLNQAVYPHIAKTLNKLFVKKMLFANIVLSFFVAVSVFLLAPFGVRFFAGERLNESILLLRILTLWIFCGGITTYIGAPVLVSFGYPKAFNCSVIFSTITLLCLYGIMYVWNGFNIYWFAGLLFFSELVVLICRLYLCIYLKILKI